MSRPTGPSSPLSPFGVDTFAQRYGSLGTPTESNFGPGAGPYGAPPPRAPQTSPPSSQHPSGGSSDMSGRPSATSSIARPPSSASSVGRSSDGRMGLGKPPPNRDSGRSFGGPANEDALQRHYGVLRQYLASSLRDEKGNLKPNRARDKLLRLSATQFMELSTDVYDELMRREDDRLQRVRNVPRFLLPRQNFHPKRNQARQKLSTLPTDRFKQLATDVFFELERRIPRFAGAGERPLSNSSNSSRGGMRGLPPRGASRPGTNGSMDSYGRPLPKTLQQNTIVPNKGTMVEDDDDEDDEDAFGLDGPSPMNTEDKEKMVAQEAEINELKARLEALENQAAETVELREKVEDLEATLADHHELEQQHEDVKHRNDLLQRDLDDKVSSHQQLQDDLSSHQQLQDDLQREVDQLRRTETQHDLELRELRAQAAMRDTQADSGGDYEQRISQLQQELANQEKTSIEVREQAMSYLQDMRELSRQNDAAIEQEEKLAAQVVKMEREIEQWRQRYAQVKAQNKSLRASTIGLGIQTQFDSHSLLRQEGILSSDGLVRDVDVTHFQMAIDELLKSARQPSSEPMLDGVKNVVVCVQSITSTIGTDGYPTPSPSPLSPNSTREPPASVGRLKARVTGTANSLITATKQHSSASGLSPVVLLDAAASNLTAAVVELLKAVGIRPSADGEPQADRLQANQYHDVSSPDNDHHYRNGSSLDNHNHYRNDSSADMESYYDDRNSEDMDRHEVSIPVPQTNGHATDEHITPPEQTTTSPFNLGGLMRSDTLKKSNAGGWFGGWNKKSSVDETAHPAVHDDFS